VKLGNPLSSLMRGSFWLVKRLQQLEHTTRTNIYQFHKSINCLVKSINETRVKFS